MPSTATNRLQGLTTSVAVKPPCLTVSTTNITLAGLQTFGSVTQVEGDRHLAKGQTDASENGIYNASTGSWTRAKDFDGDLDAVSGTKVLVKTSGSTSVEYELTTDDPIVIGTTSLVFTQIPGAAPAYDQSDAEIAADVDPINTIYDITNYANLFRYMTSTQINSIQQGGSVDTRSGWVAALAQAQLANTYTAGAGNGMTILVPSGNYRVNSTIALPRYVKIIAAGSRRGAGTPPSGFGVGIQAGFAGPVFSAVEGSLTTYDVMIDGINVSGNKATYGAGHGILLTKANGVTLRNMIVSDFGSDNIRLDGAGSYGLECVEVYSATAGNANFYIDGQYCTLSMCRTDGGVYSVYNGTNGDGLEIAKSHFEGPTTRCLHILAKRFIMNGGRLVPTVTATGGAYINGTGSGFSNVEMFHQNGGTSYGIELDTGGGTYRIQGCDISGFSTCVILREGAGTLTGCAISGNTTGLELVGGSYSGEIVGNHIGGVTNSILHTSGNGRWRIGPNRLCDAAAPQTFKRMVVTAGFPIVSGAFEGTTPVVASASSIDLPYDTDTVFISGTTNITSINASGHTNRTVTLIFQGILTFTDGSNLKIAGNFVTSADDSIKLFCDGTSFYEVARSAN